MSIITSIIIIAVASNTNTKGGARCVTMTIFPTLLNWRFPVRFDIERVDVIIFVVIYELKPHSSSEIFYVF